MTADTRVTPDTVSEVTVPTVTTDTPDTVTRPSLAVSGERRAVSRERFVERVPTSGIRADASAPRLSRADFEAWATFGGEWDPFKKAWLERFRMPPLGSATDDDEHPSQRSMLYQVLDAWPSAIAEWVREAPKGASASRVIAHVLTRWHEVRDSVATDDEYDERKRMRRAEMRPVAAGQMQRLRDIVRGER